MLPPQSRPRRVLHVIRRLDRIGGAERIVTELVRELAGHDVLVFAGEASAFDLGGGKFLRARNFAHAIWICTGLRRQYDVFHLHLPPSIYLAILFGQRTVVHEHSTHIERRRKVLPRILSRIALRRAGATVAVSDSVRDVIVSWKGSAARVFSLPNFIARLPSAKDTSAGTTTILMVASFRSAKRQDELIRALPFMPDDVQLSFAGDGPNLSACRDLAQELGVAHRITFQGSVRDISRHYASARLCALLSEWEGFGLVVLEAASFGKATVVSDIEGLRDSCPDPGLLYAGSSPQELADKLMLTLEFCEAPAFCAKLRTHAKAHDLSSYASRLEEIYSQLDSQLVTRDGQWTCEAEG